MSKVNEWQHLKIPFKDIEVATENFKTLIGRGGYGWVYKGKLLVSGKETTVAVKRLNEQFGQGLKEFLTEIQLLSGQHHPNLISLVGYCDEGKEKTIVYEYAERGSLDQYIRRSGKNSSTTLTWLQRLKICADAARGLDHLHNHVGGHRTIIHRDIKSSNILIDENWVGKISDLGLSKLSVSGFGMSVIVSNGCGTQGYCEPEYYTTGFVTKKSDVFSFGVVLFEVLCGRLCLIDCNDGFRLSGISAKEYYKNNSLDMIIDPSLKEHIGSYSMTKFAAIAYRCLHDDREQRPTMDVVVKELEEALRFSGKDELREVVGVNWSTRFESVWRWVKTPWISRPKGWKPRLQSITDIGDETFQLRNKQYTYSEVQSITDNFKAVIGKGEFGTVFHGSIGVEKVAVKMFSDSLAQGYREFQAEVGKLLCVNHKNLTSLVGYCDEGSKKGIIYEFIANGNLGMHLFDGSPNVMSWKQRVQIGYDVAQGLMYMHYYGKIAHRSVKCSNILLNEKFQAKLADFGLSRAFTTEGDTHVSTVNTDSPAYLRAKVNAEIKLARQSDIYGFGVVLLELITGRPAISENLLIVSWLKSIIGEGNIDNIIDPRLRGDFDSNAARKVVELAMACVQIESDKRPAMIDVMMDLKTCLRNLYK